MTDKAVNVADYYKANAEQEREYVRVYAATPVREGDTWVARLGGGLNVQQSVDEDGYRLRAYTGMQDSTEEVLSTEDFKAQTQDASQLHPSQPKEDLSEEDLKELTPIKKGKEFVAGGLFMVRAETDGFLVHSEKGGDSFISNYALTSVFNYAGQKRQTHEALVVSKKDEPKLKGIILSEDVTFDFKSGPYEAKKGSFIFPNADDEDGYTAMPPGFAAFGLRRNQTDAEIAAISNVALDNAVKVHGPLKLQRKS